MITRIYSKNEKFLWSIIYIWLIIASVVALSLLTSCSNSKSIRGGKKEFSKKMTNEKLTEPNVESSIIENQKNDMAEDKNTSDIKDFTEKIIAKNSNINPSIQNSTEASIKKIPTLREQMMLLVDEQTYIKGKINNLQNDVAEIKTSINELKTNINSLKSNTQIVETRNSNVFLSDETDNFEPKEVKLITPRKINQEKAIKTVKSKNKKIAKTSKKEVLVSHNNEKSKTNKNSLTIDNKSKNLKTKEPVKVNNQKTTNQNNESTTNDNFGLALKAFQSQDYNKAIELLNKNLSQETNTNKIIDNYYWLGESYYGLKKYDVAVDYFNKVLKQKSHSKQSNAQILLAECLTKKGEIAEAKKAFQSFITKYPNSDYIPRAKKMLQQL